jgi:hypothetical protein
VSTCVVDASVAAKWFLPAKQEPLANEALQLFKDYATGLWLWSPIPNSSQLMNAWQMQSLHIFR